VMTRIEWASTYLATPDLSDHHRQLPEAQRRARIREKVSVGVEVAVDGSKGPDPGVDASQHESR
jgi:hypothetical protein